MTHVHYYYVQINVLKFKFTHYTVSSELKSIANTTKENETQEFSMRFLKLNNCIRGR